jgi:Fe-S cluster assembly ATP-binding protein
MKQRNYLMVKTFRISSEKEHTKVFPLFSTHRNPGVSVTNFIRTAINETRKANGQDEMPANEMLKVIREKSELLEIDRKFYLVH